MSRKTEKRKLDRLFSKYIRERDTDWRGYGQCCTCGKPVHKDNADAGHFISRDNEATRYDEKNVHLQCRKCNRFQSGRQFEHGQFIDKKYGEGTAEKLLIKSKMRCHRKRHDYIWLQKEIKKKLSNF